MGVFALANGRLVAAAPTPIAGLDRRVLRAVRNQALEFVERPLFEVGRDDDAVVALDPAGNTATIVVVEELDADGFVSALARAGRNSRLTRKNLGELYPGGPEAFAEDFASFVEASPAAVRRGPRLFLFYARAAANVQAPLVALQGVGVEARKIAVHRGARGLLVEITDALRSNAILPAGSQAAQISGTAGRRSPWDIRGWANDVDAGADDAGGPGTDDASAAAEDSVGEPGAVGAREPGASQSREEAPAEQPGTEPAADTGAGLEAGRTGVESAADQTGAESESAGRRARRRRHEQAQLAEEKAGEGAEQGEGIEIQEEAAAEVGSSSAVDQPEAADQPEASVQSDAAADQPTATAEHPSLSRRVRHKLSRRRRAMDAEQARVSAREAGQAPRAAQPSSPMYDELWDKAKRPEQRLWERSGLGSVPKFDGALPTPLPRMQAIVKQIGAVRVVWSSPRKGINYTAHLSNAGLIEVIGVGVYADPSDAAQAASGLDDADGWHLWRVPDGRRLGEVA